VAQSEHSDIVNILLEKYVKHNTCGPKMNTSSWSINVLENCLKWYSILLVFRHNTIWQWCNNKQTNKTLGRLRYHFSFLDITLS
jgi:hypothetical protein